jgi:phage baseplate assembly protein W
MTAALYRGFSSVANTGINTGLFDINLVQQDLLNQFNTRLGERRMRPNYGSVIHDLLFDLSDSRTEALIVQDAERIILGDPRVRLLTMESAVDLDNHSIRLDIKLKVLEFDMILNFAAIFEAQ